MNDPHVETLAYDIEKSNSVDFDQASSVEIEGPSCIITVDRYRATVTMTGHFASANEARAVVDPFLRAWEFSDDLNEQNGLRFVYAHASLIDRQPKPGMRAVSFNEAVGTLRLQATATGHARKHAWPKPVKGIEVSAEVEILRQRWLNYRMGRELLASAAYFAVTVLESTARIATGGTKGARRAAAAHYNIEYAVIHKLAELTAGKGGDQARKAEGLGKPLSSSEQIWITATFKALVIRAAERAYGNAPPLRQLSMADLPPL